ncbi:hypothetical protein Syun_006831 [Stephania yunnanensis]|uniref:Uncharacterized protein n=1 Tax=Stephania yunnanensis TaxID=152371 RepID=A0AAP0KYC4_9MAGN
MGLSSRKVSPSNTSSTHVYIEDDADNFAEEDGPHVVIDALDLANRREALPNLQASFMNGKWL